MDTPWGSNVSLASWGLAGPKAGAKGQWSKGARVVTEHEAAEYRSAVSALLWLYKMTRPDLGYALSQLTKQAELCCCGLLEARVGVRQGNAGLAARLEGAGW